MFVHRFKSIFLFLTALVFILAGIQSHAQSSARRPSRNQSQNQVPAKVYQVLDFVLNHGEAPEGYIGGRRFGNYEGLLPKKDNDNHSIFYREWDVNPKQNGKNRGAERLVTGSNKKAYYTKNHYRSFIEIR